MKFSPEQFPQPQEENNISKAHEKIEQAETDLRVPEREQVVVTGVEGAKEFIEQNSGYDEYHIIPLNKEGQEQEAFAVRFAEEVPPSLFEEAKEVLVRINTNSRI